MLQVTVPPCGYRVYDLVPGGGHAPAVVVVDERSLENDHLRVELDDHGLISSIFDKTAQRQVLAPDRRGNQFQLHPDYPNFYDAWDIDRFTFDQVTDLNDVTSIEVVEAGPLRAGIKIVREFGQSRLTQVIRLDAGSPHVDFETNVQWHETNRLLKVAFPVDVRSPRATYEIQYGHVERPTHANTSWDVARFEVCAHKWADLSEPGYGVALLNDCKYGYDIAGNVIRLSLLRAPRGLIRWLTGETTDSRTDCPPYRGLASSRDNRRGLRPQCSADRHGHPSSRRVHGPHVLTGLCRRRPCRRRSRKGSGRRLWRSGDQGLRGVGTTGTGHRVGPLVHRTRHRDRSARTSPRGVGLRG